MTDSSKPIPEELRIFTLGLMQRVAAGVPENVDSLQELLKRTSEINGLPFSIGILTALAKEEITGARFEVFHKLLCRDNPDLTIGVIAALLDNTIPTKAGGELLTPDVLKREIDALAADASHRPSIDPVAVEKAYKAKLATPSRS